MMVTAVRHGAPARLLGRMAGNIVGNALLNLIPLAGPAMSIWFRSNSRNNDLLQRHLAGRAPGPASLQARLLLGGIVLLVLGLLAASILLWATIFAALKGWAAG